MSFSRLQFLGLTVESAVASGGFNEQSSTLTLRLVESPSNGDFLNSPGVGQPVYFQLGAFTFGGLLQRFSRQVSVQSFPTYEAVVVDPRELIRNVEVIVGQYSGSTFFTPNLINAYGYFESTRGYGASFATEAGMPWVRILQALDTLMTSPVDTAYGGPIRYRGNAYSLDLSDLPTPPAQYYVGGGATINLMDVITQICQDCGVDYFVDLVGYQIRVRTVNRAVQPQLQTITGMINSNLGGFISAESGVEDIQGQIKSVFLIGGDKEAIYERTQVYSFWGYDLNGQPIVGTNSTFKAKIKVVGLKGDGADADLQIPVAHSHILAGGVIDPAAGATSGWKTKYLPAIFVRLNASPVADILGATTYQTNEFELRAAMTSIQVWLQYMARYRKSLAEVLFGSLTTNILEYIFQNEQPLLNIDKEIEFEGFIHGSARASAMQAEFTIRRQRLYQFLQQTAREYYGRRYLVPLPFVMSKVDPDAAGIAPELIDAYSAYVRYSENPTDRAYSSTPPLGLPELYRDLFSDVNQRWEPFCLFSTTGDLSGSSPSEYVVSGNATYMKCQIAQEIVIVGGSPYALVTLNAPFFDKPVDSSLDLTAIAALLQMEPDKAKKAAKHFHFPIRLHPAAKTPNAVAVPLKSNVDTYGPWVKLGGQGRVKVEQDQGLVPWNYGGQAFLNQAAQARVQASASEASEVETGSWEIPGTPLCSLGESLSAGGPVTTSVNIQYGVRGFVTTYRFQTYTQKFGNIPRMMIERMREIRMKTLDLGRSLRQTVREGIVTSDAVNSAKRGSRANKIIAWDNKQREKQEKKETPHDVIYYTSVGEGGKTLPQAESADMLEAIVNAAYTPDDTDEEQHWGRTAVMSWPGLVRGITVTPDSSLPADYYLPLNSITPDTNFPGTINSATLNPFASGNDVMGYLWGEEYGGFNAYRRAGDVSGPVKVVGLRGPMLMAGWGYDIHGNPVPGTSGQFITDYMARSDQWKAGPIDNIWDPYRKVWTSHDLIRGEASGTISANGSGWVTIHGVSGATPYTLLAHDDDGQSYSSGEKVNLGWFSHKNRWQVIGGGGGGGSISGLKVMAYSGINSPPEGFASPELNISRLVFFGKYTDSHVLIASGEYLPGFYHNGPFILISGFNFGGFANSNVGVDILDASYTQRGLVSTQDQEFNGSKTFASSPTLFRDTIWIIGKGGDSPAFDSQRIFFAQSGYVGAPTSRGTAGISFFSSPLSGIDNYIPGGTYHYGKPSLLGFSVVGATSGIEDSFITLNLGSKEHTSSYRESSPAGFEGTPVWNGGYLELNGPSSRYVVSRPSISEGYISRFIGVDGNLSDGSLVAGGLVYSIQNSMQSLQLGGKVCPTIVSGVVVGITQEITTISVPTGWIISSTTCQSNPSTCCGSSYLFAPPDIPEEEEYIAPESLNLAILSGRHSPIPAEDVPLSFSSASAEGPGWYGRSTGRHTFDFRLYREGEEYGLAVYQEGMELGRALARTRIDRPFFCDIDVEVAGIPLSFQVTE